jgi:hypothetical protein
MAFNPETHNYDDPTNYAWSYPVVVKDDEKEYSVEFHYPKGAKSWHNCDPEKRYSSIIKFQPSSINGLKGQILRFNRLQEDDTENRLLRRCAVLKQLQNGKNSTCREGVVFGKQPDEILYHTFTFPSKQGRFYHHFLRKLGEEGIHHKVYDKQRLNENSNRRLGVYVQVYVQVPSSRHNYELHTQK